MCTFIPWTRVEDRPDTRSQTEVTLKPACHSKHAMAHLTDPQDMWTRSVSHAKLLRQSHRVRCDPLRHHACSHTASSLSLAPIQARKLQVPLALHDRRAGISRGARHPPSRPDHNRPPSVVRLISHPLQGSLRQTPDSGLGSTARICHASVSGAV